MKRAAALALFAVFVAGSQFASVRGKYVSERGWSR